MINDKLNKIDVMKLRMAVVNFLWRACLNSPEKDGYFAIEYDSVDDEIDTLLREFK